MSTLSSTPPTGPKTEHSSVATVPDELFDPARQARPPLYRARAPGRDVAAYLLILFGVLFLAAAIMPLGGGGVFILGIGLAFLVTRLVTHRYGYAVPAGILTGLGSFVALRDVGLLPNDDGGWAVIFLGLGFLAIYPLAGHFRAYWPLIPGAILITIGITQLDAAALAPLAAYGWVLQAWPILLVLLGLWILARDSLTSPVRTVVGAILVFGLIVGGILAIAAAAAASVGLVGTINNPVATMGQTTTLTSPVAAGQTLRITNATGGNVRVIAGNPGQVRAQVTRQFGFGPPAAVDLAPGNGGVTLDARSVGFWPNQSPSVSLDVEAPGDVPLSIETSSGSVVVNDRIAAVQITSSSGSLAVSRVDGAANLRTSSGSIAASDITGALDMVSSSGAIDASGLKQPRNVQTSSGSIVLSGTFSSSTRIQSSSGSVAVRLAPDSSTRISAGSSSGTVTMGSLMLTNVSQSPHHLDATLGTGAGTLAITTSSGGIRLDT